MVSGRKKGQAPGLCSVLASSALDGPLLDTGALSPELPFLCLNWLTKDLSPSVSFDLRQKRHRNADS